MRNRFILAAIAVFAAASYASSQDIYNPGPWNRTGTAIVNTNLGAVGIGTSSFGFTTDTGQVLAVSGEATGTNFGILGLGANISSVPSTVGAIPFYNTAIGGSDKRVAQIFAAASGATNTGNFSIATWIAGVFGNRFHISNTGGISLGSTAPTMTANEVGMTKITASGSAPGAGNAKLAIVCGTNAGTAKLIIYAGTSTTPVTITDNIGTGVTGC